MPRKKNITNAISRRTAFGVCAASLSAATSTDWIFAQSKKETSAKLLRLNRYPRMMQDYLGAKIAAAEKLGQTRRAAIQSRTDAESYVNLVRRLIRESFGEFPEKTPLNPRITGVIERNAYRIEKVIFESRPQFPVTANLYIPSGVSKRCPAVIGSCGHSQNGKAAEPYQSFAQNLARIGYVVLIFDPIGQGERLQYVNESLKSTVGAGVDEHLLLGNQQFLVGEFFGTWRAWDGVRALDYLLSRPEVDHQHVGITGNSGGGTMTTWLCGLDSRWTMAAPSCFVTTFRRNFDNELPADTEQCPPNILKLGIDHCDFLAAMAPKPVIIIAAEKDYFDVRGAVEAYDRLRPLYALLGAEQNIRLFIGPNAHGYSQPNREAMYEFFNAQTGVVGKNSEQKLVIEADETLWCTPKGQVSEIDSKTVVYFTNRFNEELKTQRTEQTYETLRNQIAAIVPVRNIEVPAYEILRPIGRRLYPKPFATWYAVETEPLVRAIVIRLDEKPHSARPPFRAGRAILYVSHQSSDEELRGEPLVQELMISDPQSEVYAMDVRGIGDSQPQTCGEDQFLLPYGSDYFYAAHSIMLGLPYPVQRTYDILRIIDWIKSFGRTEIHLVALGWGTIPATFAAILSDEVQTVTLKHGLASFASIAASQHYEWPLSSFVPNILKSFDLPDCYRSLAIKRFKHIEQRY